MKIGESYAVYQHTVSTLQFISTMSIPETVKKSDWAFSIQKSSGCKAIGVFTIKKLKNA